MRKLTVLPEHFLEETRLLRSGRSGGEVPRADTINPPRFTLSFYDAASPPKFLLTLFGAAHLPPYTNERPQLHIVERVTIAFFDRYLTQEAEPVSRLVRLGTVRGIASLAAQP